MGGRTLDSGTAVLPGRPEMRVTTRSAAACASATLGISIELAATSRAGCGLHEDGSRTSYREIVWEDFSGPDRKK